MYVFKLHCYVYSKPAICLCSGYTVMCIASYIYSYIIKITLVNLGFKTFKKLLFKIERRK